MRLQHQAFQKKNSMLKGCLHCHTTRSDGKGSPEEVIRFYHQQKYDFLALTDHTIYNYTNYAPETNMTILGGMEYDATFYIQNGFRCYHTVCLGPSQADGNGFSQDEFVQPVSLKHYEDYQPYLDQFHQKNNLTILAHPVWSNTPAKYFEKQKGNFAMEIWNTGSAHECDADTDAAYWDELLGQNIRIWGVATDDTHSMEHAGFGWVMVNAENNINSILKALRDGAFYSSCGPQIYDFYVDGDKVVIECSPVKKIRLHSDCHTTKIVRSSEGTLTHAEISMSSWEGPYDYVRMTIIDENGNYAWTNPIFFK